MEEVIRGSVRQNGNQVMFKTSARANCVANGKLVGIGTKGLVTKLDNTIYVYDAKGGMPKCSIPESQWNVRRGEYIGDYC